MNIIKESNDIENLAFNFFYNFNCKRFDYKIAKKKNVKIERFRELLAAKLLGLSENTNKTKEYQQSQYNIAIRENDSGISIRRACKLYYSNKRC